ncbi:MAG: DUF484 family protein, partial [Wenzhouxiangella sp.]
MATNEKLSEKRVIEWLNDHPDLFRRRPELLDGLELPHDAGADSLIEVQVARLRKENRQLKVQLQTLAGIAGENERLMQRLHQLTLEIMTTASTAEFIERLINRLAGDFEAASVRLHLLKPHRRLAPIDAVIVHDQEPPDWFEEIREHGEIVFGRLTRAKLEFLFPERHREIGSAAVVPVNTRYREAELGHM